MSKIQMAIKFIKSLPPPVSKGYILCDSCYSNKKLFGVSKEAGYAYVGGLRTNRVIYPPAHERLGIKLNRMTNTLNFSVGLKVARNEAKKEQVSWIFNQASIGNSIETVFKALKIA